MKGYNGVSMPRKTFEKKLFNNPLHSSKQQRLTGMTTGFLLIFLLEIDSLIERPDSLRTLCDETSHFAKGLKKCIHLVISDEVSFIKPLIRRAMLGKIVTHFHSYVLKCK